MLYNGSYSIWYDQRCIIWMIYLRGYARTESDNRRSQRNHAWNGTQAGHMMTTSSNDWVSIPYEGGRRRYLGRACILQSCSGGGGLDHPHPHLIISLSLSYTLRAWMNDPLLHSGAQCVCWSTPPSSYRAVSVVHDCLGTKARTRDQKPNICSCHEVSSDL